MEKGGGTSHRQMSTADGKRRGNGQIKQKKNKERKWKKIKGKKRRIDERKRPIESERIESVGKG